MACPKREGSIVSHTTFQLLIQPSSQNKQEKQMDHLCPDLDFKPTIIYLYTGVFTHSSPAAETQSLLS